MTSKKIDKIIKLVKENNSRNNVEIISELLAIKSYIRNIETLQELLNTSNKTYKYKNEVLDYDREK